MIRQSFTLHHLNPVSSAEPLISQSDPVTGDVWESRVRRFEVLVRRLEPVVYPVCLLIIGDPDEADRCCEDAFVEVFRSETVSCSAPLEFLHAVLHRVLCRTRPMKKTSADGIGPNKSLWYLMTGLSSHEREIVVLRFINRWSSSEMASFLDVPESEIRTRVIEAISRLGATGMGSN